MWLRLLLNGGVVSCRLVGVEKESEELFAIDLRNL
jgi:hypothetical protein